MYLRYSKTSEGKMVLLVYFLSDIHSQFSVALIIHHIYTQTLQMFFIFYVQPTYLCNIKSHTTLAVAICQESSKSLIRCAFVFYNTCPSLSPGLGVSEPHCPALTKQIDSCEMTKLLKIPPQFVSD